MWLLAELFEELPEAGDLDKPKLVFFFDEAHLLFNDASKAFLERIEQTVKLIRSKGVGVFFCTQLPTDIPNDVLVAAGRARAARAARVHAGGPDGADEDRQAPTRRPTHYDLEEALTSLGTGEAIVTVLSERGAPTPGRLDPAARAALADGRDRRRGGHGGREGLGAVRASTARRSTASRPTRS